MKKTITTIASIVGFALIGSCAADTGGALVIEGKEGDPGTTCVFVPSQVNDARGVLDIGSAPDLAGSYTAAFRVGTNLPATFINQDVTQADQQQPNYPNYGSTNNNIVLVERAIISFTDVNDAEFGNGSIAGEAFAFPTEDNPRVINVSGSVANTGTNLNAQSIVFTDLISVAEAQAFHSVMDEVALNRIDVFVSVQLEGSTSGSGFVRSRAFQYPVSLCRECLTQCPVGTVLDVANPLDEAPCFTGQDRRSFGCVAP